MAGREITMIGLVLIGLGCGCVKPCYQAIGGDQFQLPEQVKQMLVFFSMFSIVISLGTMVSQAFAPILRQDVECFGENDCYPLSFGVAAIFIILAFGLFNLLNWKRTYTNFNLWF